MSLEVTEVESVPEYIDQEGIDQDSNIVILPREISVDGSSTRLVDADESSTIQKLLEQEGIAEVEKIDGEGTRAEFGADIALPSLYFALEFILENPDIVVVTFELLAIYYSRRTSGEVSLSILAESDDSKYEFEYEGPAKGLQEIPDKLYDRIEDVEDESVQEEDEEINDGAIEEPSELERE
ncbi:hypothetical protein HrrHm2_025 [Halorubrum virus Humcor2]|uniref:hypothetical protein n=1 Tax=Halorubrum coriense TaxID=64713 RepID=UPI001268DF40|nr:hypothetical protein [Halorubrum coriense]QRG24098.1 hypothetical protein HrrHm2_025 [Halorubrum virus Humcor2]